MNGPFLNNDPISYATINDHQVWIQLFGEVRITANQITFRESDFSAPVAWNMLVYLLVNRSGKIQSNRLAASMEAETERINAPKNARTAIKRIAKRCKEVTGIELVSSDRGGYWINQELDLITDYELFEQHVEAAKCSDNITEKIHHLKQAASLYGGPFFESHGYDLWMANYVGLYAMHFLRCMDELLELLYEAKAYEDLQKYAVMGLGQNPNEKQYYLYSYLGTLETIGEQQAAIVLEKAKKMLEVDEYYWVCKEAMGKKRR